MTRTTTYTTIEGTEPDQEEQHMPRTIQRSEHDELYAMMAEIGDGIFVAWDTCSACHEHVTQCSCKTGPVEPPYIKQWRIDRFEKSFSDRGALPRLPQQLRSTDAVRNKVLRELLDEGFTVIRPGQPVTQAELTVERPEYKHTHYSRLDASPAMLVSEEPFTLMNEEGYTWQDDPADWSTEPVYTDEDGEVLDSDDENPEDHEAGKPSLAEVVARAQNSSATDPTWRTDYSQEETP